jgi:hypothetical protein
VKIFNLEKLPQGVPANKTECIVIGTQEEWRLVLEAVEAYSRLHPKKKKLALINKDFDQLAIF